MSNSKINFKTPNNFEIRKRYGHDWYIQKGQQNLKEFRKLKKLTKISKSRNHLINLIIETGHFDFYSRKTPKREGANKLIKFLKKDFKAYEIINSKFHFFSFACGDPSMEVTH